jgi:hypothetical protein
MATNDIGSKMLKELLSPTGTHEDDWDGHYPWYNRHYEFSGTRIRFIAGDLLTEMEHESGGLGGLRFDISLDLCQEDIPEFYLPDNPDAKYDIHTLNVIFWRWGIYLSIRGQVHA